MKTAPFFAWLACSVTPLLAQAAWQRTGPEPRFAPAVAYEPNTGFGHLYGGSRPGAQPHEFLPELWRYEHGDWQPVATQTAGPVTAGLAVSWPGHGVLYVSGATSWLFDGHDWSQLATANAAPSLDALAFDASHDCFVGWRDPFFGGTWSFDGLTWQRMVPSVVPSGSSGVMAWHENLQRVLLVAQSFGNMRRVYSWTGSDWDAESGLLFGFGRGSSAAPTPRGNVVVSGGFEFPFNYGATLFWPSAPRLRLNGVTPLLRKVSHSWYDPVRRQTVMTSAADTSNGNRTTIYLDINGWHYDSGGRRPWSTSSMAYDSWRGRLLMFGGLKWNDAEHGEVWQFDGSEWSYLDSMPSWARVQGASVAFDSRRGCMIVFGGGRFDYGGGAWLPYGGVFLEWDGVSWQSRTPTLGTPWPELRIDSGFAYDPVRGRALLFGGRKLTSQTILRDDTWEWDGNHWIERFPTTMPPAGGQVVFDSARGACVLAAGGRLWQWTGQDWLDLGITAPASTGWLHYDAARELLLWRTSTRGTFELRVGNVWQAVSFENSFGDAAFDYGSGKLVGYDQGGTFAFGDGAAATIQSIGTGCIGSSRELTLHGDTPPRLGSTVALRLENAPLQPQYLAALGAEASTVLGIPVPIDLTPLGMTGCSLYMPIELFAMRAGPNWPIPVPVVATLLGGTIRAQAFVFDHRANPLGLNATNAVRLRFGL